MEGLNHPPNLIKKKKKNHPPNIIIKLSSTRNTFKKKFSYKFQNIKLLLIIVLCHY